MNGSALLIYGAIIIIAVLAFWTIMWKQLCSPVWKTIYILIGTGILAFAVYSGYYVIHNSVFTERVVETSAKAVPKTPSKASSPVEIISSVECYKAAYELFNSHFSNLLTFLGVFGTIFGLAIPAGAYLLQRQTLKDEKEILQKNIDRTYDKVSELMEKYEELKQFKNQMNEIINTINKKNINLEHFQHELFMNLQTTFDGVFSIALFLVDAIPDREKIRNLFCMMLISFDNAVNCAVKANNSKGLIELIRRMKPIIEIYYKEKYSSEFRQAIATIKPNAENNSAFVSGEEIQKLLGDENYELYKWYKELYEPIYPWKFNGHQKKA